MRLSWEKVLSVTDALQPTEGNVIPFLRLTSGENGVPHETWFREEFFADVDWVPGDVHGHGAEIAEVAMRVIIDGAELGVQHLRLTHRPERAASHSAPTTQLSYSIPIRNALMAHDFTGWRVRLTRLCDGEYRFEIL